MNPFKSEDKTRKFLQEYMEYQNLCEDILSYENDEGQIESIEVGVNVRNLKHRIKYFYDNTYSIYDENLIIEESRLSKKSSILSIDLNTAYADFYCRILTMYAVVFGKDNNNKITYTPNELNTYKFITKRRYSGWKAYLQDSIIADAFGMKSGKYKISGVSELLDYTKICILIFAKCVEIRDIDRRSDFWRIVKTVLVAYKEKRFKIELTDEEKNRIMVILTGVGLFDNNKVDFIPEYLDVRRKDKKFKKEEIKEIKKFLAEFANQEREKYTVKSAHKNVDLRTIEISSYLAPIMAGICENFDINPFFVKKTIWTSTVEVQRLGIEGEDEETVSRLEKNYAILKNCIEYKETLQENSCRENLLEAYQVYVMVMINYIRKNKSSTEDQRIQYYAMEQLLGFQFITVISEKICEGIKSLEKEVTEEVLVKHFKGLKKLISDLYLCNGVLTKIKLAEDMLSVYFSSMKEFDNENSEICNALIDEIHLCDKKYRVMEKIYVENIGVTDISITDFRNQKTLYTKKTQKYSEYVDEKFYAYTDSKRLLKEWEDKLKEENGKPELNIHDIKKEVKKELCGREFTQVVIKEWVIREVLFVCQEPNFYFEN